MLIRDGSVRLNGRVRRDPETPVQLSVDKITVLTVNTVSDTSATKERPVAQREFVYLAMNKPRGIVTTASDEKGRDTVYTLLDKDLPWVAPVGRLDKASEGLLLLTNDSEWAAQVLSPESHVAKTYHVQIRSGAPQDIVLALTADIASERDSLRVAQVSLLRQGRSNAWLEIVLHEGKNRQIRRILGALDVEVLRLMRVAIGSLLLGALPKGKVRKLSPLEKRGLDPAH